MGISDGQRIVKVLKSMPGQRATIAVLGRLLREGPGGEKWTDDRVRALVEELHASASNPVFLGRRGVHYFGAENLGMSGLYEAVGKGAKRWGRANRLGDIDAEILGRSKARVKGGTWSCPDVVMNAARRAGSARPVQIHVVEVEIATGFDIPSVYQAYEQARGADYAWVFFPQDAEAWPDERISAAAKDLGVGLVTMANPNQPSGWKTVLRARDLDPTRRERAALAERLKSLGSTLVVPPITSLTSPATVPVADIDVPDIA